MNRQDFPSDFIWGSATASYQVEGAAFEDGKGASIWNEFEKLPGAIADNASGDVSCDQYHRYKEDVALMRDMGLKVYRFSMAWSRIFPEGGGKLNPKGMDYYKRLCDELHDNGLEPWITFYHWDLPQALQERFGGWRSRECAKYFADYVAAAAGELKGRCDHYFTFNEFLGSTDQGYFNGVCAPGLRLSRKERNQVRHNALYAHGLGLQVLRDVLPGAKVGIAENPVFFTPVIDTPEHVAAAKKAFREVNGHFITAIMEGGYPESYLAAEGADAPVVGDGDFKLIGAPMDFLGLNIYYGRLIRSAPELPEQYEIFYDDASTVWSDCNGMFQPAAVYWGSRIASELWKPEAIIISENGTSCEDRPARDGEVYDLFRVKYLRAYMESMSRAIRDGVPVKGYFHWSFLDNLEWGSGYRRRFGLYFVNYRTGERIPKLSAKWFKELIQTCKIV
ncbi:MAG: beta-glucosidase [Lentisphaeria bacterium]|nr:beta-glucosidase [Lentisphaeria bacterium]